MSSAAPAPLVGSSSAPSPEAASQQSALATQSQPVALRLTVRNTSACSRDRYCLHLVLPSPWRVVLVMLRALFTETLRMFRTGLKRHRSRTPNRIAGELIGAVSVSEELTGAASSSHGWQL